MQTGKEVVIGVRKDTPPFIWEDEDTGTYIGFLWDVCTEAVQRAGYRFHAVPVDAGMRRKFLKAGAGNYDLLCDPTTITYHRLDNFTRRGRVPDLSFSQILFVANGTYIHHGYAVKGPGWGDFPKESEQSGQPCADLLKWQEKQKAADGNSNKKQQKEKGPFLTLVPGDDDKPKKKTFEFWGYVGGSTIGDAIEQRDPVDLSGSSNSGRTICRRSFASHKEAAKAYCSNLLARYYGDADIVAAAISNLPKTIRDTCISGSTFAAVSTYEPYAFVLSSRTFPDFPERFSLALYGMFTDGTMDRLFNGHFPPSRTKKSQPLSTLFSINAIRKAFRKHRADPQTTGTKETDPGLIKFRNRTGRAMQSTSPTARQSVLLRLGPRAGRLEPRPRFQQAPLGRKDIPGVQDFLRGDIYDPPGTGEGFCPLRRPVDRRPSGDEQASPVWKSGTNSPTLPSTSIFPSVLKKRFPLKSGKDSVPSLFTPRKPGRPPRWETSTPSLGSLLKTGVREAMKKVSARSTSARATPVRPSRRVTSTGSVTSFCRSKARAWIYCGQLPKLWSTAMSKPSVPTFDNRPVQPVAPPGVQLQPKDADLAILGKVERQLVSQQGKCIYGKGTRIGASDESRFADGCRRPDPSPGIEQPQEQHRLIFEKHPVLIRHGIPENP